MYWDAPCWWEKTAIRWASVKLKWASLTLMRQDWQASRCQVETPSLKMQWMCQCCTKDHTALHGHWRRFLHPPPSSSITHFPALYSQAEQKEWVLNKNKEHLQDPGFTSSPRETARPIQLDRNEHVPNSHAPKQAPQHISHSKDGVSPITTFSLYHWWELRDARHAQEGPSDHKLRATLTAIMPCPQYSSRQLGLSTPNWKDGLTQILTCYPHLWISHSP